MLWLHLVAIVLWIGGIFAVSFVAVPAIRKWSRTPDPEVLIARLVRRFIRLSRELILIVFLSGLFSVLAIGYSMQFAYTSRFLWLVSAKFLLFLALAVNQMWHGLRLVPQRRQKAATASSVFSVALAAVILYFAIMLRGA